MRLAGQLKMGYFPCPPDAVALAASFLQPPVSGQWSLLDPCAGEGDAIRNLAGVLKCQPERVHAIELDEQRTDKVLENLPGAKVLAPASVFGCQVSYGSMSAIWCNPPFDNGYSSERVEAEFVEQVTRWLCTDGILILVCPEDVATNWGIRKRLLTWYKNVQTVPFPGHCRQYKEVIVFAQKCAEASDYYDVDWKDIQTEPGHKYALPERANPPATFRKVELTDTEWRRLFAASPLRQKIMRRNTSEHKPSPPLSLSTGHLAMLLASGHLDGVVTSPSGQAHVVRGTARKVNMVVSENEVVNEDESVTTTTIQRERIDMVVRAIDASGTIHTFAQPQEEEDSDE